MDKTTLFLYLKTLKHVQNRNYYLDHTLFHLQRHLRVHEGFRWERLFVLGENKLVDDGKKKTLRTLIHHELVHPKTNQLTTLGEKWLTRQMETMSDLNTMADNFFLAYKGELAFDKSCFETRCSHTLACHLCENVTCQKEESIWSLLTSSHLLKWKNPYKSYSSRTSASESR